jgi:outer membrane protein assembly factor BamD (BamD/ComL family)
MKQIYFQNKFFRYTAIIILFLILRSAAGSSELEIITLAESHIKNGEYYNAITEVLRYQFLYPNGKYHPKALLITGEAYFKGGNYEQAGAALSMCYNNHKNSAEGESALYNLARMRLITGSTFNAYRTFQEYNYIYKQGAKKEEVSADMCHTLAVMNEFQDARKAISDYRSIYPDGKYLEKVNDLEKLIDEEASRPKKNVWISFIGSVFLPGFGHFYTEKYNIGFLSLLSNAALIYLIYDGYRDRDKFRMILFSVMELSFYQYSLFSAVSNVYEYNSRSNFNGAVLGVYRRF